MTPTLPLALPTTTTFADWSDLGTMLLTARRKVDWLIGDWFLDGTTRYGDEARDRANALFKRDVDRFAPIVDTCRAFPEQRRHEALTFGHHLAVMQPAKGGMVPIPDADQVLTKAETDRMTVAALRAHVRVTTDRQTHMLPDDDPEDAAMRRIAHAWNQASRAARQSFFELAEEAEMGVIEL